MPNTAKRAANEDPADLTILQQLAELLERGRVAKDISKNELAKLAGVSRSNVRFALGGGNVTVLMLLKLTRALELPSAALGDLGLTVVAGIRQIEEATSQLAAAVEMLRGKPDSSERSPSRRDDTDAQVADLVSQLTANAKTLGHDGLSVLDGTLSQLVANAKETGVQIAKVKPRGPGWRQTK